MKNLYLSLLFILINVNYTIQAQNSKVYRNSEKAPIKGVFKTDITAFFDGILAFEYEIPFQKSSFGFGAGVDYQFNAIGLGINYKYYILEEAPRGLYFSLGTAMAFSTYENGGSVASISLGGGYQWVIKNQLTIDINTGYGKYSSSSMELDNSSNWYIGVSIGSPLLKK